MTARHPATTPASPSTHLTRRHLLRGGAGLAGVLGAGALLQACGGSSATSATSQGATAAALVDSGREIPALTVAVPSSLSSLYPGQEAGIYNYYVAALVGEGLLQVDATGALQPALAESYRADGPTRYVFTLRSDATFSDGTALTADDVVYSVELASDAKLSPSVASYWANLDAVRATGEHEVTFTLKAADVAFPWVPTATTGLWVTSRKFGTAHQGAIGTAKTLLFGTGPYQVTSFAPDSSVVFERVDTWWGGTPKTQKITVQFIPDETTRLLARRSGDVDIALGVSLAQADQWEKTAKTRVVYAPDRSYLGLTFNTALAPFDDVHVRRVFAYAADRQAYVTKLLRGHGQVATALTTPEQISAVVGADQATTTLDAVSAWTYDLEKAKAELAQSTTPQGFSTTVTVSSSAPQVVTALQALAAVLKPLGIVLTLKEVPTEQWLTTIGDTSIGLAYMWYFNTTGDPAELAAWLLGAGNPAAYTNDKVTAALAEARAETDATARIGHLVEAQRLANDDLPYLPLWWGQGVTAFSDTIGLTDYTSYSLLKPWGADVFTAR